MPEMSYMMQRNTETGLVIRGKGERRVRRGSCAYERSSGVFFLLFLTLERLRLSRKVKVDSVVKKSL